PDAPVELGRPGRQRAGRHVALVGGIEEDLFSGHAHVPILLVTICEPIGPPTHPPTMAENIPAREPATTIGNCLSWLNLEISISSSSEMAWAGRPSPHSSSRRHSRSGLVVTSRMRARTSALDHPSAANVRQCSGEITSRASEPGCLGWPT